MLCVDALSVNGGLFLGLDHRFMKYIMGKHHWDNKTIKRVNFVKKTKQNGF